VTPHGRRLLFALLAVGLIGRLVLGFATAGHEFDIGTFQLVADVLKDDPLDLYTTLGQVQLGGITVSRWPYPPGSFPWALATDTLARGSGLPFDGLIHLLPSAMDVGLAWLVQEFLGRRGASERARLLAAALVVLGPSFWMISGYHGQIDAVAILPAVAALIVWDRASADRRALYAGLLIGVGGAVKTVPLFMVLPLLPWVRSRREGATLIGAAGAVWLVPLAPWLLTDFSSVRDAMAYTGGPGLGGYPLLLQPELPVSILTQDFVGVEMSSLVRSVHEEARLIVLAGLGATAALLFRFRPPPVEGAVLMWLAFYVVSPAFFFQYLVWGMPFFIMAGHLKKVAVLQGALLPPMLIFYTLPWESHAIPDVYVVIMGLVWVALVVACLGQGRRIVRAG